jgi:hypothetical protein
LCSIGKKPLSGAQGSPCFDQTHLKEMPQILVSMEDSQLATLPNCGNPLKLDMETKKCNMCNENKTIDMFARNGKSLRSYCKKCRCIQEAERRKANFEAYKEKDKKYYEANKEEVILKNKQYRSVNRDTIRLQKKKYYEENKEKILQYHTSNKSRRNERIRKKSLEDPCYKIKATLRARIHDVLKNTKVHKTNKLIGCSKHETQEWLEFQFGSSYCWETYGTKWHIDHVIPISFFNIQDEYEQRLCFNWTNLRPLNAKDNLQKSSKIDVSAIIAHIETLKQFPRYQANYENSWWRRVELRYGNNPQDDGDFENHLKWAIRNQITN